jgi:hypothetical protein
MKYTHSGTFMKFRTMALPALPACLAIAAMLAAADLNLEEKETVRQSWTLEDPARFVVTVDNIEGSIEVTGTQGREVEMVADRTTRAGSPEAMLKAKQEVRLDFSRAEGEVRAYVDAPWRCKDGFREYERRYRVRYDFTVRVPAGVRLFLRTINDGEVLVRDISGDYDIRNINGGIVMSGIGGSGKAYALNGKLEVRFLRNPQSTSYFGSLNGDVDLYFLPGLAADLRLKTFNGGIFTDFPVSQMPVAARGSERKGNRFVYRSNDFFGARVGKGGPEITLDGFNGDIRLHEVGAVSTR